MRRFNHLFNYYMRVKIAKYFNYNINLKNVFDPSSNRFINFSAKLHINSKSGIQLIEKWFMFNLLNLYNKKNNVESYEKGVKILEEFKKNNEALFFPISLLLTQLFSLNEIKLESNPEIINNQYGISLRYHHQGLQITMIKLGSKFDCVGLKISDVLTSINNKEIKSKESFFHEIENSDKMDITFFRNEVEMKLKDIVLK